MPERRKERIALRPRLLLLLRWRRHRLRWRRRLPRLTCRGLPRSTLGGRRRWFWLIRLRVDDRRFRILAVGQPDVIDRMLDAMQAGACPEHPAGENPLYLALKGDLIDLDEGVGIGGFGRRACVASVSLHPQRAELHGFADILVKVDDAAGDLVETGEDGLLVDDLLGRRLGDDLVPRLQRRRCRRSRAWLLLSGWQARLRVG